MVGPFYRGNSLAIEKLVHAQGKKFFCAFQAIGIYMIKREPALIFIYQDESGAGYYGLYAQALGQALDEYGFARAQRPRSYSLR